MELLEKILHKDNLNEAYKRVVANKGASGVDEITVDELKIYLIEHGAELVESIRQRKYKPQPVLRVEIPKENGKVRKLGIPTVVDRVVQQAVMQVLSPIYEEQFSNSSYGFRVGRSCEMAVTRSLELINDGYDWIVDIDLERFFDTVHHDRLMNIISRTVTDGDVISLIRKFLVSGVMVQGKYEDTTVGTPQGGNLSPLLSNIMLNELDKELESRGLSFVRYADDCNIFVKSEKAAERVMRSITDFIQRKLGLIVNAEKSKIGKPTSIKFLGFGYFAGQDGKWYAKPHKLSYAKMKRKLKALTKRSWSISLDVRLLKLKQLIVGWVNYFRIAKMKTVLEKLDEKLRKRIRVIIWKQWKKFKARYEALLKLGANKSNARRTAGCRKGYQYVCGTATIHSALSNKRLKQRGLTTLLDHFKTVHLITN
jgi:group II intron reverse transcriptase/maturase